MDVLSVPHFDNRDGSRAVIDGVDDTIGAHPDPVLAVVPRQFFAIGGSWIVAEFTDATDDALAIPLRINGLEFSGG